MRAKPPTKKSEDSVSATIWELMSNTRDIRVLYVEDNDLVRESMRELIAAYGMEVTTASNGMEALERYEESLQEGNVPYDIVATDIRMPKMGGIELIEKIRALNERQLIVVLSAHNESDELFRLIELEVSHFLPKPIVIDEFEMVMGRVISIIDQRRQFRKMHEELERTKRLAEEATRYKSQFLANMSHEIRTPLNAIIGFINLLSEGEDDEVKLKYLDIIKNASDSLLQIINDILDISKIESGKLEIEPFNFKPYRELMSIAELFQVKAAEKEITFTIDYGQRIPELLYGDALRIKQILTNLLSNAIKFTPEGGTVKCRMDYHDGTLSIEVEDQGIGISGEQQEKIFQPFMQADGSIVRKYGGTGLGLTISMQLSRLLGGQLSLQSQEGQGSIFTLQIPVPVGKEVKSEEDDDLSSLQGHILMVEDYEANRMFVGIILENAGLSYEIAKDGCEAVEKFKAGRFDLILMDENMPNMNGTEATKRILQLEREHDIPHTPVISLTANALKGDRERFLEAGFDDYLSKPIDPKKLLRTLKRYL